MAAQPLSVRPAPWMDQGSAARTAQYGGVAGAARGAYGGASVGARGPRAAHASGEGSVKKARGGTTAEVRPALRGARARDVTACWRPASTVLLAVTLNSKFSKFFE
jgi:hypothetical protein